MASGHLLGLRENVEGRMRESQEQCDLCTLCSRREEGDSSAWHVKKCHPLCFFLLACVISLTAIKMEHPLNELFNLSRLLSLQSVVL